MITYTSVRELLLETYDSDFDLLALVTHYLQSTGTEYEEHYAKARKYLNRVLSLPELGAIQWNVPFPPTTNPAFTFVDLFAGIGGFRIAFQNLGGKCVFSSEWDRGARNTYERNFGEVPFGDITKIKATNIPRHDILLGGFPCQAFSIAGHQGGFEDTRGTLFFDIARILSDKRPSAFFLENVKGLMHHHGGKTISRILEVLRGELGYHVPDPRIVNAKDFGVPQNRERVFIIGFLDKQQADSFKYPTPMVRKAVFGDVKESTPVSVRYYLSEQYLRGLRNHKERHQAKGHGFGFEIVSDDSVSNTLVLGGMGKERNLVVDHRLNDFSPITNIRGPVNKEGIRKMTPREWARLQGFPESFITNAVAETYSYKQIANAVAIPAIEETGKLIIRQFMKVNGHE